MSLKRFAFFPVAAPSANVDLLPGTALFRADDIFSMGCGIHMFKTISVYNLPWDRFRAMVFVFLRGHITGNAAEIQQGSGKRSRIQDMDLN
jgi:hypothetical protein